MSGEPMTAETTPTKDTLSQVREWLKNDELVELAVLYDWLNDLCDALAAALTRSRELEEQVRQYAQAITEFAARERQFGNLLAVLHRDGGHYLTEHGWEKAARDAEAQHYSALADADRLRGALKRLEFAVPSHWTGDHHCPACGRYRDEGHRSDCWLSALLAATQGGEGNG